MRKFYGNLFCFSGLPAIIVVATAAAKPDHLGPANETHAQL